MASYKCAAILAASLGLGVSAGHAASPVPDTAGAFVAYCPGHFADCKAKVVETDVAVMAGKLYVNKDAQVCVIPKGIENDIATKEILAWLGKHKNVAAMKTDDAIQAAFKGLWHCKSQIGDGSTPGGPPAKTGAFVAYCPTHAVKCANKMVSVVVAVMIPEPPEHCAPPHSLKTQDMSAAVLGWLEQHKETYGLNTDEGIEAAFDHLWPCH